MSWEYKKENRCAGLYNILSFPKPNYLRTLELYQIEPVHPTVKRPRKPVHVAMSSIQIIGMPSPRTNHKGLSFITSERSPRLGDVSGGINLLAKSHV